MIKLIKYQQTDIFFTDNFFMNQAILEAKKAFKKNEVPIGAVVVDIKNNKILSRAHNLTETKKCQTAHAEIRAIEKATKVINNWRLSDCSIYVTLEPCSMCMNLILLSRLNLVVFGLNSKVYGYSIDKFNTFELYKSPILIREGVGKQESLNLLKEFFKDKRNNHNE